MKNIIIFGAPGSGKGTYSDEIVKRYGMGHISTGDVLRAEIKNDTELGKIAQGYISNGQLIPDDLMIEILAKTYDAQPAGKGVIFDGFPRTIAQANALKQMLGEIRLLEIRLEFFFTAQLLNGLVLLGLGQLLQGVTVGGYFGEELLAKLQNRVPLPNSLFHS